jgi:hypothetical protein
MKHDMATKKPLRSLTKCPWLKWKELQINEATQGSIMKCSWLIMKKLQIINTVGRIVGIIMTSS